jgi:endonuclease/exonuclease/phosphatase family metal-dependent hydrolase
MKKMRGVAVWVGMLQVCGMLAACEPAYDNLSAPTREAPIFVRSTIVPPDPQPESLAIMDWNIKFGGARIDFWFDLWGDRVQMSRDEVEHNLDAICMLINEVDPDVLMVEEIEVNSRRSAYVDMVRVILERTQLNYAAYFQTWDSRYVPSQGLGRMDLGNAIFSKYPISQAQSIRQPDRTDQDPVTEKFYLHRAIGDAVIEAGAGRLFHAFVVHTEAYDQDGTKAKQLEQIHALMLAQSEPFVLAGDFNELPPNAFRRFGFPDEHPSAKGTDFEQPPYTPEKMQPFFDDLVPAIALAHFGASPEAAARYFSHSVIGPSTLGVDGLPGNWNRTLDYIFASPGSAFVSGSGDVLQDQGRQGISSEPIWLSDHAPVVARWQFVAGMRAGASR